MNSNNLQFKFLTESGVSGSNHHDGLMLNVDFSLIFQPGLNITNSTSGAVGCDVWELGCSDSVNDCDGPYYDIYIPCRRYTYPPVANLDPYFESYHLFDSGFYRDFGTSWDSMITVNEHDLSFYVERYRPLYTYAGLLSSRLS